MHISDFEQQLKEYKENLHPNTKSMFFPRGESEIDFIAKNLVLLVESEIKLSKLMEIFAYARTLMTFYNPSFPYETYQAVMKKIGNEAWWFDVILILSYISSGVYTNLDDTYTAEPLNSVYREAYRIARQFDIIDQNTNGDEMTGAYGRFGYDKTNPIPFRGYLGINEYFGKLRSNDGKEVAFKRIGSFTSDNIKGLIDAYRINPSSHEEVILYINIYNSKTSRKAPDGFVFA